MPLPMEAPPEEGQQPNAAGGLPDFSSMDAGTATRMFQDPRFLTGVARIAVQNKQPQAVEWLKRANAAAHENVFEALQLLETGDGDGAIAAFNKSGRYNDATGAKKNDDGTWTISRKGGKDVNLDPAAMRRSLLSPKDYFEQQARDRNAATNEQYRRDQMDLGRERNKDQRDYQRRLTDNAVEIAGIRADAQRDVADARGAAAEAVAATRAAGSGSRGSRGGDKNSPVAFMQSVYEKARGNGASADEARLEAEGELANHPGVVTLRDPKTGSVGLWDRDDIDENGKPTAPPLRQYANAAEFEKRTRLSAPAGPAPQPGAAPAAAAPAQGGPKEPGLIRRLFSPSPQAAAAPAVQPGYEPPTEGNFVQRHNAAQAQGRRLAQAPSSSAPAAAASFDEDVKTMPPAEFAAKYDAMRGQLTKAQLQQLNKIIERL